MKHFINCVNQNLTEIYAKSSIIKELAIKVQQYLPESLKSHCKVSAFNQGRLLLSVSNNAFATELRFLIPELMEKLRSKDNLPNLISIKISMELPLRQKNNSLPPPSPISAAARQMLTETALNINCDSLKAALLRLADSRNKSSGFLQN